MDKQTFFATAAQIIPVFLLTLALGDRWLLGDVLAEERSPDGPRITPEVRAKAMTGVVMTLMAGELFAIAGMTEDRESGIAMDVLSVPVIFALAIGVAGVGIVALVRIRRELGLPLRPERKPKS